MKLPSLLAVTSGLLGLTGLSMVIPVVAYASNSSNSASQVLAVRSPDTDTILKRATDEVLDLFTSPKPVASIDSLMTSLSPQGTWPDIDYTDQGQGTWAPAQHLDRLLRLVVVYQTPGANKTDNKRYHDPELRVAILKAYDAWFSVLPPGTAHAKTQTVITDKRITPTSTNWWHNEIGVPLKLGPIILLMREELSQKQLAEGIDILARSWTPDDTSYKNQAANLTWRSRITTWQACLQNDTALLAYISQRIAGEIVITDKEGLQSDFSFWQHGPQLYSLGYGRGFSLDMTSLATLYAGTAFAFKPAVLDNISHHMLDGQQWMMRGDTLDNSARGREIVRKGAGNDRSLIEACDRMIALHAPRASEFVAFRDRISGDRSAPPLIGNRAFWRSDFMTHQRPEYYASVRATSQNIRGSEYGNTEGARSYYTGDGVNFLYRTGKEYEDIAPVWDWTRLPGVTCPHSALPPKMPSSNTWGVGQFAGGASDGKYGATVYDYTRDGLSARKAWFFFDREYVCLGAGITRTATEASSDSITTSVNQCWLRGGVLERSGIGGTPKPHPLDPQNKEQSLPDVSWVFHDRVGYVFPSQTSGQVSKQNVVIKIGAQSGNWTDVKLDSPNKERVTGDVFGLWLDHGANPKNADYSYVVVPEIASGDMDAYVSRLPITILANNSNVQAVYHSGLKLTEAGFYEPGKITLPNGTSISVSGACVVLVRETATDRYTVSVADPHHIPSRLWVGGNQQFAAQENVTVPPRVIIVSVSLPNVSPSMTHSFALPTGMSMGQTVIFTLTRALDRENTRP